MELIKQLSERADELMDQETFERLVKFAIEDIAKVSGNKGTTDDEMLDVIYLMIENIAGYEDAEAAADLANRVLAEVKARTQ